MGNETNNKLQNFTNKNSSKEINRIPSKNNSSKCDCQNFINEINDFQSKKPKRFATLFQWDGDGTNVYLTGSFCDWEKFFVMEKYEDPNDKKNNKFFLTLFLPKGSYQYKFKIDDRWKCNSNFPTCSDKNGNINNIIDLTKQKGEEGTTDFSTSYVITEQKMDEIKISSSFQFLNNKNNSNSELSVIKPEIGNFSENSSIEYKNNFNDFLSRISNNQKKMEKNDIKEEQDKEFNLYENSYKNFFPLKHEHFDHLSMNINTVKNFRHNKHLIYSCSYRYGFKKTIIIYYKPKLTIKKG